MLRVTVIAACVVLSTSELIHKVQEHARWFRLGCSNQQVASDGTEKSYFYDCEADGTSAPVYEYEGSLVCSGTPNPFFPAAQSYCDSNLATTWDSFVTRVWWKSDKDCNSEVDKITWTYVTQTCIPDYSKVSYCVTQYDKQYVVFNAYVENCETTHYPASLPDGAFPVGECIPSDDDSYGEMYTVGGDTNCPPVAGFCDGFVGITSKKQCLSLCHDLKVDCNNDLSDGKWCTAVSKGCLDGCLAIVDGSAAVMPGC